LVDAKTLQRLENQLISAAHGERSVTIATPLKVWKEGNHICELHPYYEGINLYDLVERNKYKLGGDFLGVIYNCGLQALSKLHELGVLHRDLTPDNMMITPNGNLLILDVSFCCEPGKQHIPVQNEAFSPPEQALGYAVRSSDWYSLASSIYFLANGVPPSVSEGPEDLRDKILNIDFGSFSRRDPPHWEVIESMLDKDVGKRPTSYLNLYLRPSTVVPGVGNMVGVFDNGKYGFMILFRRGITIGARSDVVRVLQEEVRSTQISDELRKDVGAFLAGRNPWVIG
jgi:serine/threonine protein kinase